MNYTLIKFVMPHLQFDINKKFSRKKKIFFITEVKKEFSRIMKTGKDHIAISFREFELESLSLGRANINEIVCLMNLDILSPIFSFNVETGP